MAAVPQLRISDLPSVDTLVQKSLRKGEKLINSGKSPEEATQILEARSVEFRQFLLQGSGMLEDKDKALIRNGLNQLYGLLIGASVVSIFGNLFLNRLTKRRFSTFSWKVRIPTRWMILIAPYAGVYNYSWNKYTRVALYLEDKYSMRLELFKKTGNPSALNPELDG